MRLFIDRSGLLIVGSMLGLIWANIDVASHRHVAHVMRSAVNDVGMAFFFALAAEEVSAGLASP